MQNITVKDAYKSLQDEKITLIDVREEDEFAQSHIEGAQLCCLSDLPKQIEKVNIPEDNKVFVYCLKGGRASKAIEFLSENVLKGFDVYNIEGGITEWSEQDLPLVHPNKI